jgi:hypothetical protein
MKKLLAIVMTLVMVLGFSITAFAAVTFDAETGKGFVGKGDVQNAFGWNNAEAQTNIPSVTFSYVSQVVYDVTIEWTTGTNHETDHKQVKTITSKSVNGVVSYEARRHSQIDGINLTGFGNNISIIDERVPQVGDWEVGNVIVAPQSNNPNPSDHVVTAVTKTTISALYVTYNGTNVVLPITPIDTIVQ